MYWIEVYFENGKTLRKVSNNINGSYKVFCRYSAGKSRPRVQSIKCGYMDTTTMQINKLNDVVT